LHSAEGHYCKLASAILMSQFLIYPTNVFIRLLLVLATECLEKTRCSRALTECLLLTVGVHESIHTAHATESAWIRCADGQLLLHICHALACSSRVVCLTSSWSLHLPLAARNCLRLLSMHADECLSESASNCQLKVSLCYMADTARPSSASVTSLDPIAFHFRSFTCNS